jgi:hypothetical protein
MRKMMNISQAKRYVKYKNIPSTRILISCQGISLTVDQYKAFLQAVPQINASLKSSGIEFDEMESVTERKDEHEEKQQKRAVKKESRANIEETSDEEE